MSNPGRLRHRFTLEAPVDTPDGAGGAERNYVAVASFWGRLDPASLNNRTIDETQQSRATHRLTLRARDDLTTEHRLRLGAQRQFRLLAFRDGVAGYMEALVEESHA